MNVRLALIFILGAWLTSCGPNHDRVRVELPLPPRLDVQEIEGVYLPGFLLLRDTADIGADRETKIYFRREITRNKDVNWVEGPEMALGDADPKTLFTEEQPLFAVQESLNLPKKTLLLTGAVQFDLKDRSGFRSVQTTDRYGRVYNRSIYAEMTSYELQFLICAYNSETGKLIYREFMTDQLDIDGPPADNKLAFYELLQRMSGRILGLFSDTKVKAERRLL
jgi:hypothetical protein